MSEPKPFGHQDLCGQDVVFGQLIDEYNNDFCTLWKAHIDRQGNISGNHRPNESRYAILDGTASLLNRHGQVTTRISGPWSRNPEIILGAAANVRQTRFLFKHRSIKEANKRILYTVASNVRYVEQLQLMLYQLYKAGISKKDIWVTVSDASKDALDVIDNVTYSHVPQNAFEYLALLDVVRRNVEYDYVFLIHDTCYVGSLFRKMVEDQPCVLDWDYMSVTRGGQFNIGLYSVAFLRSIRPFLETLIGLSKQAAIDLELNRNALGMKRRAAITTCFVDTRKKDIGRSYEFGSDVERQGIYLHGADLYKFYRVGGAVDVP